MEILTVAEEAVPPGGGHEYLDYEFVVEGPMRHIDVRLRFHKVVDVFQLYAALFDSTGAFRGHVQCPGEGGPRDQSFRVGRAEASLGCVAGDLPTGRWTARIDFDRAKEPGWFELTITGEAAQGETPARTRPTANAPGVVNRTPGWYRGELHCHSRHSDGRGTVEELVEAGAAAGLDFLAISDHFTYSHWSELTSRNERPPALLRSIELTSHHGHINMHGLHDWVDVYVDRPDWSMNHVADAVAAQGGLIGINHPYGGDLSWRRQDLEWSKVDVLEVWHLQEHSNNVHTLGLWDRLLNLGYRPTGVAGSDCHDPQDPSQALGQLVTWVHAAGLGEQDIIQGVRDGNVSVDAGAGLDVHLETDDGSIPMGATYTLENHTPLHFNVTIRSERPAVLHCIRNGLLVATQPLPSDDAAVQMQFRDTPDGSAYYRFEVHQAPPHDDPRFVASCLRDHTTLLALSNPIFVEEP